MRMIKILLLLEYTKSHPEYNHNSKVISPSKFQFNTSDKRHTSMLNRLKEREKGYKAKATAINSFSCNVTDAINTTHQNTHSQKRIYEPGFGKGVRIELKPIEETRVQNDVGRKMKIEIVETVGEVGWR